MATAVSGSWIHNTNPVGEGKGCSWERSRECHWGGGLRRFDWEKPGGLESVIGEGVLIWIPPRLEVD